MRRVFGVVALSTVLALLIGTLPHCAHAQPTAGSDLVQFCGNPTAIAFIKTAYNAPTVDGVQVIPAAAAVTFYTGLGGCSSYATPLLQSVQWNSYSTITVTDFCTQLIGNWFGGVVTPGNLTLCTGTITTNAQRPTFMCSFVAQVMPQVSVPFVDNLCAPAPSTALSLTVNTSRASVAFCLPLGTSTTVSISIDWGDGSALQNVSATTVNACGTATNGVTHTYASAGTYTITVDRWNLTASTWLPGIGWAAGGIFSGRCWTPWHSSLNGFRLLSINSWGDLGIIHLRGALACIAADVTFPSSVPAGVTDLAYLAMSSRFNNANITSWNTSSVIQSNGAFQNSTLFNQPIGTWDMHSNGILDTMFSGATAFNQPLASWNVSRAEFFTQTFSGASSFNQPLAAWDMSSASAMEEMFSFATSFNQPLGAWNVAQATDMIGMFQGATVFDQDLTSWCVTQIPSEPTNFATGSALQGSHEPVWGTCPGPVAPPVAPAPTPKPSGAGGVTASRAYIVVLVGMLIAWCA